MSDDVEVLQTEMVLEYPFVRTTGPVIGAFLTGLREGVLTGIRAQDGRVLVPPTEFDPVTGEDLEEMVEVGPGGTVRTWAWVRTPGGKAPFTEPFAWALIVPDGADTAMVGAVATGGAHEMRTGMRVLPEWAEEREGSITDITCWRPA